MRGLNPRQIEAFRAVVLTGGVGAAASLINVTQPAVSRLIRDLQSHLGLVLFERRGTGLVPTSEALSLYAEVERAFVGLERIEQMATELRTRRAGFLRIAALPALANAHDHGRGLRPERIVNFPDFCVSQDERMPRIGADAVDSFPKVDAVQPVTMGFVVLEADKRKRANVYVFDVAIRLTHRQGQFLLKLLVTGSAI